MLLGGAVLLWIVDGARERGRLLGLGAGFALTTLGFLATMRPLYWPGELCDGFTPASTTAIIGGGASLAVLALLSPKLSGWRMRAGMGAALGVAVLAGTMALFPACLNGPYGDVDPYLRDHFIAHIDEVKRLFDQTSPGRVVAMGGLVLAACLTSAWMILRRPRRWRAALPLIAALTVSAAIMLVQIRGVYIGAPLAAPILAGLVVAARKARGKRRAMSIVAAWLVSAGVVHAGIGGAINRIGISDTSEAAGPAPRDHCRGAAAWRDVAAQPAGTVMVSTSLAAHVVILTDHATVGAGYHRNNAGNAAMYRYFGSPPQQSEAIARQWNVTYVLFCPGDFTETQMATAHPASLAAMLQADRPPAGLVRLHLRDTRLRLYRIDGQSSDRGVR